MIIGILPTEDQGIRADLKNRPHFSLDSLRRL
jgi:hypothetical protein